MPFILNAGPAACLRFVPASEYRDLYAALVCGVALREGEVKHLFVDAGLIHVLVVSGAHLSVLARLSRRWPRPVTGALLTFYAWLTGFGAPVVRAGAARVVRGLTRARGLSDLQVEFLTSVLVLLLYPPWFTSRSFLMTWLCLLALRAPPRHPRWPHVAYGVRCYLALYLFCLSHPLTVAWNALVAPALGGLIFPLAGAAFVVPGVAALTDLAWRALLWALRHGPRGGAEGALIATAWLWWLPWAVNVTLVIAEGTWRRARAFS